MGLFPYAQEQSSNSRRRGGSPVHARTQVIQSPSRNVRQKRSLLS
ncbi:Uncharacterised protein [Vibrio cholerae]|nr:Uncharacterised protein [Vibrio cholerae]